MNRLRDLLPLLPLAACYVVLGHFNPALAPKIPLFLAFVAAFVVLPALGLGGLLVRLPLSPLERLALGSPAALVMLFGLAYAEAASHLSWLLWLQPVLGVGACCFSIILSRRAKGATALVAESPSRAEGKDHPVLPPTPWPDIAILSATLLVGLALCMPKFLSVSTPLAETVVDYYTDDMGTASYIYSALRAMEQGLPVMQCALAGVPLSYHLFYHYCCAACTQVTALHPLDLLLFLFPPFVWLLLAGAVVTGCRRLAGFSVLETVLAVLLLLFSAGYGFNASHTIQLFAYQHTYFFGLPPLILFLCLMYGYLTGRTKRLYVLFGGLCFFAAAGSKANLLLLLPLSLLPVFVVRLFRRQLRLPEVSLAALCILSAVALRVMLYTNTARASLHNPRFGKIFLGSINGLWDMGIVVGVYVVLMVLAADANPPLRAKLNKARQFHLFAACAIVLSTVLLKVFNFIGGDFYFYWHSRLIILLAFVPVAAHVLTWRTPKFVLPIILVLSLGLAASVRWFVPVGIGMGMPQDYANKVLDGEERAGLLWASENIPHSRVAFTNKDSYLGYYLGGYIRQDILDYLGLSGLQGYAWPTTDLEGEMRRTAAERVANQDRFLRSTTPEAAAQALASIDADYYLHCIRLGPVQVPACLREVHRTASLVIYENTCRTAARP